jgi:hypothetical protein
MPDRIKFRRLFSKKTTVLSAYYVDATAGNNSNNGRTPSAPWQTIAKVNSSTFLPGDYIFFKRGETWNEQLVPPSSGDSTHQITFGAYGTGNPPVITGTGSYNLNNAKSYVSFYGIKFTTRQMYMSAGDYVYFDYCLNLDHPTSANVYIGGTGTHIYYRNCTNAGAYNTGFQTAGTTVCYVYNSIFVGNGYNLWTAIFSGGTSVVYDYNMIIGNNRYPGSNVGGTVTDGGHNITTLAPGITHYANENCYFCLTTDDFSDVTFDSAIDSALTATGGKFTKFIVPTMTTAPQITNLIALAAAGHEIAIHSWSHSQYTLTTAFALTSTNADPTIDVDVATTTITLATSTAGNTVTFDYSGDKTIANLKTAVAGKGWTITNTTNIDNNLQLSSLADTSGAQVVPYSPLLDIVAPNYAYWRDEISDTKDWIVSNIGVTPTTVAYPWGTRNAALDAYCQGVLGLLGGRASTGFTSRLSSINIFAIDTLSASQATFKGDGSEVAVRKAARHCYAYAMYIGGVCILLSHTSAEFSAQQIGWFADEIYTLSGKVFQTFASIVTAIKADHSTADNLTYTKTYTNIADFHLLTGSSCINAGYYLGLPNDCEGNLIHGNPDIGAYET